MFKKLWNMFKEYNRRLEEDRLFSELQRIDPSMMQELNAIRSKNGN